MSISRPLRFLGLTVGGWAVARVVLLWPNAATMTDLIRDIVPIAKARKGPSASMSVRMPSPQSLPQRPHRVGEPAPRRLFAQGARAMPPAPADRADGPVLVPHPFGPVAPSDPVSRPDGRRRPESRWSGSGWAILRGGGMAPSVIGSRLGGAQAGVRIAYALGTARRLALAMRLTTPLEGAGREAAIGIDWRPTRLPVRIVAEHRFALDGGRGGPMVGLVGGINPTPIAGRLRLEAYGQAGAIARGGVEAFADGAVRIAHPIAEAGDIRFDLGMGSWGGAQRGAARLDVGPSLGIVVPVARRSLRLTLDWRERVAGDARPGSGPALSIGTDF
ncbi:hypothetical protein ASE75_13890 [Sphingomonas sp. Leaf17]|uniref:hypothetical protein n=1 Tax=Sphingomonas sp. Leaf17 TaxID=1735683 RepID=UPI0006FB3507|nr:hypothetical protein [Sphingomonas sp. Leaf17]KQM62711.1 hypothetical protein ASE75_13890 [Sphingomonas sp. Leaf17]